VPKTLKKARYSGTYTTSESFAIATFCQLITIFCQLITIFCQLITIT